MSWSLGEENRAIEICKTSKVPLGDIDKIVYLGLALQGLSANTTWLDFANQMVAKKPNARYNWSARNTEEEGIFIVSFTDEEGWGHNWEVDVRQEICRPINGSEYLSRKYGFSRLDRSEKFKVVNISTKRMRFKEEYESSGIVYVMKGCVINNSGTILTKAKLQGEIQLIFKDKTIKESSRTSGFNKYISKSNPWQPNEQVDFSIETESIEEIYLQYKPEYVIFYITIEAEDPVGYKYDKVIEEYNLINEWYKLQEAPLKTDSNKKNISEEPIAYNSSSETSGSFPQASERLLTASDLRYLSKQDLKIMRNEIFARHGYIFKTSEMKNYFQNQSWYSPRYDNVNSMLTTTELKNIDLIKKYE
ncbi:hypothetical protein FACS1894121_0770 [Bacteroidia bacterium]|nr:hypothetical protein FACS1894121_0770 [Bacteroidia bacterium]